MGLQTDLGMSGNEFSWLATGFFIAYAVAEIPQGMCILFYLFFFFFSSPLGHSRITNHRNAPPSLSRNQGPGSECLFLGSHSVLLCCSKELCRHDGAAGAAGYDGSSHWYAERRLLIG